MGLSFNTIRSLVSSALNPKESTGSTTPPYCYIEEMFPDQVVYSKGPDLFQRSYAITDGTTVTLGEEKKVLRKVSYEPIKAACQFLAAVEGDATGNLWNVRFVEFGIDKNKTYWTKERLTAALSHFDGVKLFALRTGQHQDKQKFGKPPVDLIGLGTKPEVKADGIYGQVAFLPTGYGIRDNLKAARDMGLPDPYGLSVDVTAKAAIAKIGNQQVTVPLEIKSVTVDVVYDPAAGGGFLQMAASVQEGQEGEEEMTFHQLMAAVKGKRSDLHQQITSGMEAGTLTEEQAIQMVASALSTDAGGAGNVQLVAAVKESLQQLLAGAQDGGASDETRLLACELRLDRALAESQLPKAAQENLRKTFTGKIFAAVDLENSIKSTKEMLDAMTQGSGLVIEAGQLRAANIVDQRDKLDTMLDDFFDGKMQSFKACYIDITGDTLISGRVRDAVRLQASIQTGTFAEFLGDAITRRALKEYNASGLDDWKKIVDVVPLGDFRTQHRPRMGGYGDLPVVEERGEYLPLATPADEEATYAPSKRGGTEDITLEAIKNDDVGVLRKVPQKLGRSAARTLYKFVFAFIDGNPVLYDGVALFHATHANLGTTALAKATLQAGRLQMMKQTEQGSAEPLGIPPYYILVPPDLEDSAYELTAQPNLGGFTPTAPDSVRRQTWEVIAVKHWADANNWFLAANPKDLPLIELGFLDGKTEPEFFVQDLPNVGSMFSNDMLTYKIRHIYGGNIMDFRGFQGNIVP